MNMVYRSINCNGRKLDKHIEENIAIITAGLGATIATMLSNLITMLHFIGFLLRIHGKTVITLNPSEYSLKQNIPCLVKFKI